MKSIFYVKYPMDAELPCEARPEPVNEHHKPTFRKTQQANPASQTQHNPDPGLPPPLSFCVLTPSIRLKS